MFPNLLHNHHSERSRAKIMCKSIVVMLLWLSFKARVKVKSVLGQTASMDYHRTMSCSLDKSLYFV